MKLIRLFTTSRCGIALTTTHCLWVIFLFTGFVCCPEIAAVWDSAITGIPSTIAQCERSGTTQECSTWKWNGKQFDGRWPNGRVGQMTVERFDADGVVITRVDQTGASPGLTATYIGKLNGDGTIQGTAVWVLNGKSLRGTWTGTFSPNPGGATPGQTTEAASTVPPATAAQAPAKSKEAVPVTMTECEGTNNCATWTFLGAQGNGQWPSGEVANLSVEHYDADTVVIRRADSTGSAAGLTAVYTGTRHGDRVGGEFTSSWPGHWNSKSGNWYATVAAPISPPPLMHFCDVNCITLQWDNAHYVVTTRYSWESADYSSIWTVESFTRESVILHRRDTGKFALTAVYKGQISKEGDSLINAANPFHGAGQPANIKLAWGNALNTVPGSNAERDRGQQTQGQVVVRPVVVCVPWFFGMVCSQ
jgi:hypothetical protein